MPRPSHATQRAVQAITLGVAKSTARVRAREAELGLAETEQQYKIPVTGTASTLPGFSFLAVFFDYPFYYAPGQRDSDLEKPLMTFGGECDADVMLGAHVRDWYMDDERGAVTGAVVVVSALAAIAGTDFTGKVNVTFQGFSAPDDTTQDLSVEN